MTSALYTIVHHCTDLSSEQQGRKMNSVWGRKSFYSLCVELYKHSCASPVS